MFDRSETRQEFRWRWQKVLATFATFLRRSRLKSATVARLSGAGTPSDVVTTQTKIGTRDALPDRGAMCVERG